MEETGAGTFDHEDGKDMPRDAKPYKILSAWGVYVSKKHKRVVIDVTDYHAGKLMLSKDDLLDLVKQL